MHLAWLGCEVVNMGNKTLSSILIANRGEIALRIISTAKAMGIKTIAVYSQAERGALHVRAADRAYCIGRAPANQSYLVIENIIQAAKESGADAIHPGYGFLSENSEFAQACEKAGIIFIGPSTNAMKIMGNKASAKLAAQKAGVECIAGYQGEEQNDAALIAQAKAFGFPLMVKAAHGGGGRGIRLVEKAEQLESALGEARKEALSAFSSETLILEKQLEKVRHIEVQILADGHGNIVHIGERDCSLQRRHQKIIEETPSPAVDDHLRQRLGEAAIKVARSVDYMGAGTIEFLLDGNGDFFFLEMNTRLQVEHGISEMISGIDIVEWQIRVARGEKLSFNQNDIALQGHAIEARLYAEDPQNNFLPSTGKIHLWQRPVGNNIRVDCAIESGEQITSHYDAMVAKIMVWGKNRAEAIAAMRQALGETVLFGPAHNKNFLMMLLENNKFRNGEARIDLIDEELIQLEHVVEAKIICLAALMEFDSRREKAIASSIGISAKLLNWSSSPLPKIDFKYRIAAQEFDLTIQTTGPQNYCISIGDNNFEASKIDNGFEIEGKQYLVDALMKREATLFMNCQGFHYQIEDGSMCLAIDDQSIGKGEILAPMHGNLVEVKVKTNEQVTTGTVLGILEAMKMRHEIVADGDGVVKAISHDQGEQVAQGELLFKISLEEHNNAAGG